LARWAWDRLVNRIDVWGAYWPLDRRQQGNSWTAPARHHRGQRLLTPDTLARHFRGRRVEHVIGLHSTGPENTSRWGAVDIDKHAGGRADPVTNLRAALAWYARLLDLGLVPLLTGSNGAGGYHLRCLFSEAAPTPLVYALLHWLIADYASHGLAAPPETFPKQPRIKSGGYGNWLRLPGRHHTCDYWSEVWDGARWLTGEAAVAHILALRGADPGRIPAWLRPPRRPIQQDLGAVAPATLPPSGPDARTVARIRAYLARLPHRSAGERRDDIAYGFAAWLVRDLHLPDDVALHWLNLWDQGNTPPKGAERLREITRNAHAYGTHAYGCGMAGRRRGRRHRHAVLHCRLEVG
jgi:hypothetical protein